MSSQSIILYAGKKLGNLVLEHMIKINPPKYLIPNLDDLGRDNRLYKSTIKIAKQKKIKILNNKKLLKLINSKKVKFDYIICAGTTIIIPNEILNKLKVGAINFHPSLLPKYRGRNSTLHAIFNGDKFTGVTCHWINTKIDHGKIIKQKKITIKPYHTGKDVYDFFTIEAFKIFKIIFKKIIHKKKISSKKMIVKTKYVNKHFPNKGEINWNWSGKKILNFIRCMTYEPFEPPKFNLGNKTFYVVEKNLINRKFYKTPK